MSAPCSFTCPEIDETILAIESAIDDINRLADLCKNQGPLEKLRNNNALLREWGLGLEGEIAKLEKDLHEARQTIVQLESALLDGKPTDGAPVSGVGCACRENRDARHSR